MQMIHEPHPWPDGKGKGLHKYVSWDHACHSFDQQCPSNEKRLSADATHIEKKHLHQSYVTAMYLVHYSTQDVEWPQSLLYSYLCSSTQHRKSAKSKLTGK